MARWKRLLRSVVVVTVLAATVGVTLSPPAANAAAKTGWVWSKPIRVKHLDPTSTGGLSCPSAKLCVAASSNRVVWSTTPTVASSWKNAALEPLTSPYLVGGDVGLYAIDCPSVHFCATVDDLGQVFTTTNPTGGASAWHAVTVNDSDVAELTAISCASAGVCVALAWDGVAFTLSHGQWHGVQLATHKGADFYAVSCPSATLCAAVESDGYIYTTNPSGSGAWKHTKVGHVPGGWDGIDCPSAAKCVATGNYDRTGAIAVSTKPSTGGWKTFSAKHKASAGFAQVQCHGTSFCFALSGGSNDYWTAKAAAADSAWHGVAPPNSMSQTELACPTTTECIVGGVDGKLHVGHRR